MFTTVFRKDGIDQGLELRTRCRDASAVIPRVYFDEHADLGLRAEVVIRCELVVESGESIGVVDDDIDAFRLQGVREMDQSWYRALGDGDTV